MDKTNTDQARHECLFCFRAQLGCFNFKSRMSEKVWSRFLFQEETIAEIFSFAITFPYCVMQLT